MTVFAHAGHWLAGLAYAAPVFVLAGWLAVVKVKDRRDPGTPAGSKPLD